jgi:hypothetical protein
MSQQFQGRWDDDGGPPGHTAESCRDVRAGSGPGAGAQLNAEGDPEADQRRRITNHQAENSAAAWRRSSAVGTGPPPISTPDQPREW